MLEKASGEIRETGFQLRLFLKENPLVPWITAAAVLISYGVALSGFRIGIDAEANLNDPDAFLNSWYSIGRFSLVFTKNLFGLRNLNPFTANLLMMAFMFCYGIFADFLFFLFSGNGRGMRIFYIIFPALFLTHPCYVQQYLFTVQAFEVALSTLICLGAVMCVSKWAFEEGKGYLASGLLFMVWSFGSYQAFLPFYMAAALSVYLVYYWFHDNRKQGFYLKAALRHTGAFVMGYILYILAVKAVIIWRNGFGFQGEYLEDQVLWKTSSATECIGNIKHYMRMVLFGESVFYTKTFFIFAILFALHLLYSWGKWRRKEFFLYAMAALALVLSPFYLAIYQGAGILMRSQMSLPFAAAFFGAAVSAYLCGRKRTAANGAVLIGLLLAINQGTTSSRAMFSAYMAYEQDKMTAEQLLIRMQALDGGTAGQRVAMIGSYRPSLPVGAGIREETVGYSFFEWDYMSKLGVSKRGTGFLTSLGFPYEPATEQEYQAALLLGGNMPSWPAAGSVVRMGEIIVVKFSD